MIVTLDSAHKEQCDLVMNKFIYYRGAVFRKLFLENNSFRQTDERPYIVF